MRQIADALKSVALADRLVRRSPLVYGRTLALFDRLEAAPLEERRRYTEERVRTVLAVAAGTRYGRAVNAGDKLADWPLLESAEVRDDPAAFVSRRRTFASAPASTSGTTGTPLKLLRSPRSLVVEQACIDRLARAQGVDLRTARVAVLRGDDVRGGEPRARYWRDAAAGRRRIFSSNDLDRATVNDFADAIEDFAPACLLAYPSALESLCDLLEQRGRRLRIPLTLTSSEVLPPETRQTAHAVLGTDVVDYYGQAERVSFAYSLDGAGYTFLAGYGLTELLPAGEDEGGDVFEIVGTSLWNLTMPLVRYRTGDLVSVPRSPPADALEAVRYGLRPVEAILGRSRDYVVSPTGARLIAVNHIPRGVENVVRMQVVQEALDDVRILVIAKPSFGERDRKQIERNAAAKLPPTMRISIEVVDGLERTEAMKTPLVVRRPGVESAAGR